MLLSSDLFFSNRSEIEENPGTGPILLFLLVIYYATFVAELKLEGG
jgi:hypothetical protein